MPAILCEEMKGHSLVLLATAHVLTMNVSGKWVDTVTNRTVGEFTGEENRMVSGVQLLGCSLHRWCRAVPGRGQRAVVFSLRGSRLPGSTPAINNPRRRGLWLSLDRRMKSDAASWVSRGRKRRVQG